MSTRNGKHGWADRVLPSDLRAVERILMPPSVRQGYLRERDTRRALKIARAALDSLQSAALLEHLPGPVREHLVETVGVVGEEVGLIEAVVEGLVVLPERDGTVGEDGR